MAKHITVYLDNTHLEFMDRVRCGFIVREDENGKEIFHYDLIDDSEYPSVKELVADVAGILNVSKEAVLVAA